MDSIQTTNTVFEIFEQIPVEKRYGIIQRLKSEVIKRNSFVQLTELEFKGIRITPQIDELIKNQELFIGHRQTDDLGRQDVEYVSLWFLPKTQFVYRERSLDDCVFRNEKCDYKAIVQIRRATHKLFDVPIERPIVTTTLIGLNVESSIELELFIRNHK